MLVFFVIVKIYKSIDKVFKYKSFLALDTCMVFTVILRISTDVKRKKKNSISNKLEKTVKYLEIQALLTYLKLLVIQKQNNHK